MRHSRAITAHTTAPRKRNVPGDRIEFISPPRTHSLRFIVVLLALFTLGLMLRLPTFGRALLSDDEAIYAVTADALNRGGLLFRDVVDHKPPLIYHVYQVGFAALGRYNTHVAHGMVVLSVLLTAGFLIAIRRREDRSKWVGLAAAGLFLIFSTTWHDYDALAANCELFLLVPQTAAAWLLMRDLHGPSRAVRSLVIHLAVGVLIGISALFKYQGLTFFGATIGMLGWWAILGRMRWSRAMGLSICHVIGALLPAAVYLLVYWVFGNVEELFYWFRFNFSYVGAGLTGVQALVRGLTRTGMIGGVAFVPYALGLFAAVVTAKLMAREVLFRIRRTRSIETEPPAATMVLGVLWLVTSTIALSAGGRFFGHYFHLILAPLCLLAAPTFARLWNKGVFYRTSLAVLCILPALFFFWLASFGRPLAAAMDETEPPYDEVVARIMALTTPDDRIFVWGNSPQLYVLARRPMGARFSSCNFVTGESPGTPTELGQWNADINQQPATWNMLFADLEQRRPALFIDAATAGWDGYDKFPMARYPRLAAYVDQHYRLVERAAGVMLYRRLP